jgi:plastocyanin
MKTIMNILLVPGLYLAAGSVCAGEFEVGQMNKAFTVEELKIKVGDSVNFKNEDPFFHNVFSLAPQKTFDLGSYPKGEGRAVVFDQAGTIDVECAIHPNMHLKIVVEE